MLEWMETDFVLGGGQDWVFCCCCSYVVVFFKPIVSIQALSALEHFWPIVAKSC